MPTDLEPHAGSAHVARDILDEALFSEACSFDPVELPVYLPPVPEVSPPPEIHTPPALEYPLPPCPAPDVPQPIECTVLCEDGPYGMTNLAPGVYEVHPPRPPEPIPAEECEPVADEGSQEERIRPEPGAFEVRPSPPEDDTATPPPVFVEDASPEPPPRIPYRVEINRGLSVEAGESIAVGSDVLSISGAEPPVHLYLLLLSPPCCGSLMREGLELTGGDVFTQEDLETGRISYRHEGSPIDGADSFGFATPDGEIPPTRVEIRIFSRRRAPRLRGAGRLDSISEGMAVADILEQQAGGVGECGLAVVDFAGSGTWAFSLDEGRTWRGLKKGQFRPALLLGPSNRLRFVPREGFATVARLTYRAWDLSSHHSGDHVDLSKPNATGGATAFSAEITSATIRLCPAILPIKRAVPKPWEVPIAGADLVDGAIAIVRLEGHGTWLYSDGAMWRECKAVYHGRALLLRAQDRLRFAPAPGATGKVSILVRPWDGGAGGSGSRADLAARESVGGETGFGAGIRSWNWYLDESM